MRIIWTGVAAWALLTAGLVLLAGHVHPLVHGAIVMVSVAIMIHARHDDTP